MKKGLFYTLAFLLFLLLFAPSLWIFFALQRPLEAFEMALVPQKSQQGLLYASFEQPVLYREDRQVAEAEKARFLPLLIYNRIEAEGVRLMTQKPVSVGRCTITHLLWQPTQLHIECHGSGGAVTGVFDLKEGKVVLRLQPSKSRTGRVLRRYFYKTAKGYRYASAL